MILTRDLHVRVGIPSMGLWDSDFGMSVVGLTSNFWSERWQGWDSASLSFNSKLTSVLVNSRNEIVQQAIDAGCSHVLFLDSDQTFPPDTLRRLLRHNKPVVAANIATKGIPSNPTARAKGDKLGGVPVFTKPDSPKLEQVWRVGTGVMLLKLASFQTWEMPFFTMRWVPEMNGYEGEDWGFAARCEERGIPIFVDHTVSSEVGHVGRKKYTHVDVLTGS